MLFNLLSRQSSEFGLLIDIGSGSTLTTLIESRTDQPMPSVIWTNREHQPLRTNATPEHLTKAIITSLMNASLAINTHALRALEANYPRARISSMQVTIAAPWSFTIPQTITYQQPSPVTITNELVEELVAQADRKVTEDIKAQAAIAELGLTVTHKMTAEMTGNGYPIHNPEGQLVHSLTLTQLSVIAHTYLTDAVLDIQQKTLPQAELLITSTMLTLYETLRAYRPTTREAGIVSVGYEATEIGVIRDGILAFTTHTPVGLYTLARQISEQTDLPAGEILGYFGTPEPRGFATHLGDRKKGVIDAIFAAYEHTLRELFLETGDGLMLPPLLLLHAEPKYQTLLMAHIKEAVYQATHNQHQTELFVTYLQSNNKNTNTSSDSTALATAQFFHMTHQKQSGRT